MSGKLQEILAEVRALEELRKEFLEDYTAEVVKRSEACNIEFVVIHGIRGRAVDGDYEVRARFIINGESKVIHVPLEGQLVLARDTSQMFDVLAEKAGKAIALDLVLAWTQAGGRALG